MHMVGLSSRLTPYSHKTFMVTETSTEILITQPVSGERGATPNGIEMTQCSQTHTATDAARPNRLLTPRTTIKIGTWNVRTMFEAGKAQQIANEMSRYKISLLGISETRWTKSGRLRLASGQTILYSGFEEDHARHIHGVGFMLSAETAKTLMGWEPVNARLITARFYGTPTNISIVQGYAPTNDAEPEEKVEFYDTLQSTIDKIPMKDLLIIMGDFNAKIGSDNTGREELWEGMERVK